MVKIALTGHKAVTNHAAGPGTLEIGIVSEQR
jgi:hypothetical protein